MTEGEEMYPSVVKWCFDSQRRPVCPSRWDERVETECDTSICPYSHEVEASYMQGECQLPLALLDEEADIREVANYLAEHSLIDEIPTGPADQVTEEVVASHQDEEYVHNMFAEMRAFEEQKGEEEKLQSYAHRLCPYFQETGNCLRRAECVYAHGAEETVEDVNGRWYPSWQDCACCQGFIYKCAKEGCQKQGHCVTCQPVSG